MDKFDNFSEGKRNVTISLCMIVKNEEAVLARCLDSLKGLTEEIIIVDTGSTDRTKEIASRYTDRIYDFDWTGDFSEARNFAFSKASCEYIYSADADEALDEENRRRFLTLKRTLLPEVEIVQMYYCNQLANGSVYNFDRELRAKLFKRVRGFTWIDPVHETVRTEPVVFNSEIEIQHLPAESHAGRDLSIFERVTGEGKKLSKRLERMYAKELLISEDEAALLRAEGYFTRVADDDETEPERLKDAVCVVTKAAFLSGNYLKMYRYALKEVAMEPASEVCYVLGEYYLKEDDLKEATVWFYNAVFETESALSLRHGGDLALERLADCYERLGDREQAERCREMAEQYE
ncbi:MAG: glycosyltransferase family 2 protein [Lachnospiraceae bacterium]|nr:glycosyltransferase family 2 protein [Lachnospiraceae bacterium]